MKNDCNVVRDLMPLVIDGVASDESRELVTEHVSGCEPCAQVYADYQKNLPEEDAQMEKKEFEQVARKIKRRQMSRKSIVILVSIFLTVAVLTAGGLLVNKLHNSTVYVNVDSYDVRFVMFEGQEQPVSVYTGLDGSFGWGHKYEYDRENGMVRIKYYVTQSRLPYPWQEGRWYGDAFVDNAPCTFVDGQIMLSSGGQKYTVTEIVLTDEKNERVIYRAGDPLPAASDELRAYYWTVSTYNSWRARRDNEDVEFDKETIETNYLEAKKEMEELYTLVPEFHSN